jgi:hypothetical protein
MDSVGLDGTMNTCVPYDILMEVREQYFSEFGTRPAIVNFGKIRSSKMQKNKGLDVGLYYFYLGHTSCVFI